MPYFKVGASNLYYEEYGQGAPVVLLHGVGGNHASWFNQVPELSRHYRTIVVDQRGFGNSEDAERAGCSAFAGDLLALLQLLGLARIFLVGQSMGGMAAGSFTVRNPKRVAGLIIADSLARQALPEPYATELAELHAHNVSLSQQERVLGRKVRKDPALSLLYAQIASFNSVTLKTVRGEFPHWDCGALAATRVPVMFLAGEEDVLFPPRLVRAAHERVPGSTFHVLPDAGHSGYFETPGAFNTLVLAQLDTWVTQSRLDSRAIAEA